jgi:hypothetical protein
MVYNVTSPVMLLEYNQSYSGEGEVNGVHFYQSRKGERYDWKEAPETAASVRHAGTAIGCFGTGNG